MEYEIETEIAKPKKKIKQMSLFPMLHLIYRYYLQTNLNFLLEYMGKKRQVQFFQHSNRDL